ALDPVRLEPARPEVTHPVVRTRHVVNGGPGPVAGTPGPDIRPADPAPGRGLGDGNCRERQRAGENDACPGALRSRQGDRFLSVEVGADEDTTRFARSGTVRTITERGAELDLGRSPHEGVGPPAL